MNQTRPAPMPGSRNQTYRRPEPMPGKGPSFPPRPNQAAPTPPPPPRPDPADKPTAPVRAEEPRPPVTYHVTYRVQTPAGFAVDIERDTSAQDLPEWIVKFDAQLLDRGFKPRVDAPVVVPATAATDGQTGGQDDDEWAPKFCPDCGAKKETFYDNRTDPNRPEGGPDLKCRQCKKGFWKTPPRSGNSRRR